MSYYVRDVERAVAFYVGVLGMTEQMRLDVGNGEHEGRAPGHSSICTPSSTTRPGGMPK